MFRWELKSDPELEPISQFLKSRKYLNKIHEVKKTDFPDENKIKDLSKAVERLITAITNNEKIVIFGDDDVDGITSSYLIFDYLKKIGCQNHFYYIRNRNTDVHGISDKLIEHIKEHDFKLVITVDSCISSYEQVKILNEMGVDTIITDHHKIPEKIPPAYAVVDPKQNDCEYPDNMLAGVGVAFMLVRLLAKKIGMPYSENYLLWTAVGTVIDKAPLQNVNLLIVKLALQNWNNFNDNSLYAISYGRQMDTDQQKMNVINYIGRVLSAGKAANGANRAFEFLIAPITDKSSILIELLKEKRQYDDQLRKVSKFLETLKIAKDQIGFIYYDAEQRIPLNLIGFSASFLTSKFKIPILILQTKKDYLVCEGRCTKGFDLVKGFENCKDLLIQFGGHTKAAGCSLKIENYIKFKERYYKYFELHRNKILENKKIEIDIQLNHYDDEIYERLMEFCPYGEGNHLPLILKKDFVLSRHPHLTVDHYCKIDFAKKNDIVFKFKDENRIEIIDYKEKVGKNES